MSERPTPPVSVVIVTWLRPDYVRECLEHIATQEPPVAETLVIDASADTRTAEIVELFAFARRIHFPGGAGHMTTARNVALHHAGGEIIAFLDDDAYPRPGWLAGLLAAFADPSVGAVAGRTCNGVPGEGLASPEQIGRVSASGVLIANFAAEAGGLVEVEHGIGANMSFRRAALSRAGGFRDDFRGVGGVREDSDVYLRLGRLGYRIVFAPDACADHVGAPHARGRRFDYRYQFWTRHNHALLLARNFGLGSSQFRSWLWQELRHPQLGEGSGPRKSLRLGLLFAGVGAGLAESVLKAGWRPSDPVRNDRTGQEIRSALAGEHR